MNNGRLQRLYLITPRILTWKEAQMREQEAAEMVGEADLARQMSIDEAAGVATGSALEYEQVPQGLSLPVGARRRSPPRGVGACFQGACWAGLRKR